MAIHLTGITYTKELYLQMKLQVLKISCDQPGQESDPTGKQNSGPRRKRRIEMDQESMGVTKP